MELSVQTPKPRLWAGLFGAAGSGKTHSALDLAMATRKVFGLDGPIAMFDTERGSKWHVARVKQLAACDLITAPEREDGSTMRSHAELFDFVIAAAKAKVSVIVIDSLTHILEDCRFTYFAKHNITTPEASDYGPADKPFTALMQRLTDSSINVICCAREKQQYGRYKNSKGRMVTGPVGVKFGAKESAYDFDLLMQLQMVPQKGESDKRVLSVPKDRSRTVHGQAFTYPFKVSEIFGPYLQELCKS